MPAKRTNKPVKIGDILRPAQPISAEPLKTKPLEAGQVLSQSAYDYLMRLPLWDGKPGDPTCARCHGSGRYRLDIPVTIPAHPRYGALFACECRVGPMLADQMARLQRASALSDRDLALSWHDIKLTPGIRSAVEAARDILARGWGWLYIHGDYGPGKTLLLKVVIAELIRKRKPAVFAIYADMLGHMRAGFDAGDYEARLEAWRTAPVLAIDELGRAKESEWVKEIQVRVLNARYESATAQETITIFASNFAPEEAEGWLSSRIHDGRFAIVKITGPDMRREMKG